MREMAEVAKAVLLENFNCRWCAMPCEAEGVDVRMQ